jgi:geranylgeranyl diphosphate synthase type II
MYFANLSDYRIDAFRPAVEETLTGILVAAAPGSGAVSDAFADALLTPGKRIRPIITLMTVEALGGQTEQALAPACAIEMIHTASLIVDDLPAMDDATTRRGVPACHVKYGEDIALLTAFALLNEAYKVVANAPGLSAKVQRSLTTLCADAVGLAGLIGGQEKDLRGSPDEIDITHQEKTGALFVAAAKAGAIVSGIPNARVDDIGLYAAHLGLAFQTLDDFVDAYGDAAVAGKDVAHDGGSNVVSMVGRDRAMKRLMLHVQRAVTALEPCGPSTEPLGNLARSLMAGAHSFARQSDLSRASAN